MIGARYDALYHAYRRSLRDGRLIVVWVDDTTGTYSVRTDDDPGPSGARRFTSFVDGKELPFSED